MAESFPTSLQDKVNSSGFSVQFDEVSITSDTDVGVKKKRKRYTDPVDSYKCSIDMTYTEFNTLRDFFNTTLGGGVKTFTYEHPFDHTPAIFRFAKPPSLSPKGSGGREFTVTMEWELMP